jgi:imidazolonepropionase-like amidohydrolase
VTLLLANGRVVHGDPAVAPRPADVLIEHERIAAVGEPGAFDGLAAGAGRAADTRIDVLDLAGATILPGLIDLHVHLVLTGAPGAPHEFSSRTLAEWILLATGHAQRHLAAGVTTVRDLGGWDEIVFPLRDAIDAGVLAGPRVLASGLVVTTTNGHGSWMGAHADDAEGIRSAVEGRVAAGANAIKIVATGGVHTPGSDLMAAQYTEAELRAGIDAAHAAGLTVGSHASNPVGITNAARAGVDSVEHGVLLDDASAAAMADAGTVFVPTLAATQLYEAHAAHPSIPDYVREKAAVTVPAHRDNFPRAVRAGVTMATGTDAGSTFVGHGVVAHEVELLARFGLPPLEAIAAATRNAARLLHLEGEIGTVAAGRRADLLIVDGDPVADLRALREVRHVLRDGRFVGGRQRVEPEWPG